MKTLHLRWIEAQRYEATDSWGQRVIVDGTHGSGGGAKPADLLPTSLAACVAYTFLEVLQKRRQRVDALEATIEVEQQPEAPWMFTRIDTRFVVTGEVDAAKAEKSLALAHEKYCAVSASLHPDIVTSYTVEIRPA